MTALAAQVEIAQNEITYGKPTLFDDRLTSPGWRRSRAGVDRRPTSQRWKLGRFFAARLKEVLGRLASMV